MVSIYIVRYSLSSLPFQVSHITTCILRRCHVASVWNRLTGHRARYWRVRLWSVDPHVHIMYSVSPKKTQIPEKFCLIHIMFW